MNALRRLVSALRTTGAEGLHAMSPAQQFALRVIGRQPGLTMSELAKATLTTRSTVSEVVVRLVERGLVRRDADPQDHRRVRLSLTTTGLEVFSGIGEALPERLVRALDALEPAAVEALAAGMDGWVHGAGLGAVPAPMFGESARRARPVAASPLRSE